MPMSPRLLRPRASGYTPTDADARAYITAVQTADGQRLEPAVARAIDDFVIGCKADGIWSAIKTSCILAGARTLAGALVPLAGAAPTNFNFVAGDYNRKTGLLGGTNKILATSYLSAGSQQGNRHDAVYVTQASTGANSMYWTTQITAPQLQAAVDIANNQILFRSWQGNNSIASPANATGLVGASRSTTSSYSIRVGGAAFTGGSATTISHTEPLSWFGRIGGGLAINGRLAFASVGDAINLALLDARVSSLYTAIGAAIP